VAPGAMDCVPHVPAPQAPAGPGVPGSWGPCYALLRESHYPPRTASPAPAPQSGSSGTSVSPHPGGPGPATSPLPPCAQLQSNPSLLPRELHCLSPRAQAQPRAGRAEREICTTPFISCFHIKTRSPKPSPRFLTSLPGAPAGALGERCPMPVGGSRGSRLAMRFRVFLSASPAGHKPLTRLGHLCTHALFWHIVGAPE
jgi:hypothetical protein